MLGWWKENGHHIVPQQILLAGLHVHSAALVPALLVDGVEGALLVVSHLSGQLHKVSEWTWSLLRMFLSLDFC